MLTQQHTVLPAADLQRLRGFYHDKFGLDPREEVAGGEMLIYGDGEISFEAYHTENAGTAKNTQMGWMTDDLDAEMRRLREAGVEFLDFETEGLKTEHGVAEGDGMRSAWFQDTEGNTVCLTQRL